MLLVVSSIPARSGEGDGDVGASALADRVDRYLAPAIAARDHAGVLLIARGEEILLHGAYGLRDVERGLEMRPDATFRVASVTKSFTATLAARLAADGVVDLDAPIDELLPGFRHASRLTLRQLLTHRSGLPTDLPPDRWGVPRDRPLDRDRVLRWLGDEALAFEPGSDHAYCNPGFTVAAYALEAATGESFAALLERIITGPLGLSDTRLEGEASARARLATGYEPGPPPMRLRTTDREHATHAYGSASMVSSAPDLWRWARATMDGEIVDLTPYLEAGSFGWSRDADTGRLRINGTFPGYHATVDAWPETGLVIVSLGNIGVLGVMQAIMADLPRLLDGEAVDPLAGSPQGSVDPADVRGVEGRYAGSPVGEMTLRREDGDLVFHWVDRGFDFHVTPLHPDSLYLRVVGWRMNLHRDATGRVTTIDFPLSERGTITARRVER